MLYLNHLFNQLNKRCLSTWNFISIVLYNELFFKYNVGFWVNDLIFNSRSLIKWLFYATISRIPIHCIFMKVLNPYDTNGILCNSSSLAFENRLWRLPGFQLAKGLLLLSFPFKLWILFEKTDIVLCGNAGSNEKCYKNSSQVRVNPFYTYAI